MSDVIDKKELCDFLEVIKNTGQSEKGKSQTEACFEKGILTANHKIVTQVLKGNPEFINKLISDKTPFEIALEKGYINLAKTLSSYDNFDSEMENHEALLLCLVYGQTEMARDFVLKGVNTNLKNGDGQNLIMLCLSNGDLETAQILLDHGAEIDSKDNRGWSALIHESFKGNKKEVEFLVKNGASVNLCTPDGWNSLVIAFAYGHSEIVDFLLNNGALFGEKFAKGALLQSYKNRNLEITTKLLKAGVSPNFLYDSKISLIAQAAKDNEWGFVKEYLLNGANANEQINKDLYLISLATDKCQAEIIKLLIEKGASINFKDGFLAPIHIACLRNRADIVQLLLDKGACIEAKDKDGDTPLIITCRYSFYSLAKYLLSRGANPEQRNNEYKDAGSYCYNDEIKKLLKRLR
ncbi:ankyrin repeat domain-containing protein [Sutterella massiliensis]|uniref:Ankyrin repeat domain-containing protein n=1 Tax=Sutterella massiliensis TaxID=1816689 RepID=A0ABS2DS94_9BURK|nr:ankyrin repeat domain-containing protein [Sutterella massiliensis]MBM6704169.1 ankyrin repeat domain-containing protein [Sutterella massiliensis]